MTNYGIKIRPTICDQNNNILKVYPVQSNMVTDHGVSTMMNLPMVQCMEVATIGTGTVPTYRKEACSFVKSGANIVASENVFVEADATYKRLFQFPDGKTCRIVFVSTNSECIVDDDTVEGAFDGFVVWNTEQQNLIVPINYSAKYNTYLPEYNGTSVEQVVIDSTNYLAVNTTRTFQFDVTTASLVTEAGWGTLPSGVSIGDSAVSSTKLFLFGRILFDEPISLVPGHRMLLTVTLTRLLDISEVAADPLFGAPATWDVSTIDEFSTIFSKIDGEGLSVLSGRYSPFIEPCATNFIVSFIGANNTVLASFQNEEGFLSVPKAYRSWSMYSEPSDYLVPVYKLAYGVVGKIRQLLLEYDVPQTATIADTLRLKFIMEWGRSLPPFDTL